MASYRKELKLGSAQRDIVNFSVKAQDQILRAAAEGASMNTSLNGAFKTTDDLIGSPGIRGGILSQLPGVSKVLNNISMGIGAGTNATTGISQDDPSRLPGIVNRSIVHDGGAGDLLFPSIKSNRKQQQSPYKGQGTNAFFDMPMMLATQKMMRQTVRAVAEKKADQEPKQYFNPHTSVKAQAHETARETGGRSVDRNMSVKMNPKVLETWINETLQDAEHLDIPGVILKPEHKNPISRYGIDRLALTNAGIPNELVDRIFRALFVYSVGFYELVKKCLQHTERKYSIITAIWKVFSILLEYCCKTDYRMLISEISKEHKDELERLEKEFQTKFSEQAANERILKDNLEIMRKYTEELEKEKNSEKQMRIKLEEEYSQNTKNHEEEVQLRLKFESKLNNMHSVHRDLETKYKRALSELAGLQTINEQLYTKNNAQAEEITQLKTVKAEMESKISFNDEKIAGLNREVDIKVKQVQDLEVKYTQTQDELDLTKYKLQEVQKDLTEHKLKIDVYESQIVGLKNEKQHLQLELKETKELQKGYEKKCGSLIQEVNKVNLEFQESKREIIGFGEIQKEREDRIEKLKAELKELKVKFEELDLKYGTLCIQHDKVKDQYETAKKDLDDAIEKLHLTNKVRHETELKLTEEQEKTRSLQDVIRDKDEQLHKRAQEIEDMDKRVIELERTNENLEIKKASIERTFEITKKQLSDKVTNLNEVLQSEKETREMWIERYEKEQKEHTQTNANLLHTKSELKDQILATKNVEIKLQTTQKANEVLSEQNARLQDSLNDALAKQENLERDVNTQKEIMKQMELNRKEYIQKLKNELLTVESRFTQKFEIMEMVSQDYLSRAAENVYDFNILNKKFEDEKIDHNKTRQIRDDKENEIQRLQCVIRNYEMQTEDYESKIAFQFIVDMRQKTMELKRLKELSSELEYQIDLLRKDLEEKKQIEKEYTYLKEEHIVQKNELFQLKKLSEKLNEQVENQNHQLEEQQREILAQSQLLSENTNNQSQLQQQRQVSQGQDKRASHEQVVGTSSQEKMVAGFSRSAQQNRGKEVYAQTDLLMRDLERQLMSQMQQQQQMQQFQQYPQSYTNPQMMQQQPMQQQMNGQMNFPQNLNQNQDQFFQPIHAHGDMSQIHQNQGIQGHLEIQIDENGNFKNGDPNMSFTQPLQSPFGANNIQTMANSTIGGGQFNEFEMTGGTHSPMNNTIIGGASSIMQSPMGSGAPNGMMINQQMMMQQQQQYQQPMSQQQYQGGGYSSLQDHIIPEHHAEDEEDRKSPMGVHINTNPMPSIEQKSQHSLNSQQNLQNGGNPGGIRSQQNTQLQQQRSITNVSNGSGNGIQRTASNKMQVEYKNMNTVMQNQMNSQLSGGNSQTMMGDRKGTGTSQRSQNGVIVPNQQQTMLPSGYQPQASMLQNQQNSMTPQNQQFYQNSSPNTTPLTNNQLNGGAQSQFSNQQSQPNYQQQFNQSQMQQQKQANLILPQNQNQQPSSFHYSQMAQQQNNYTTLQQQQSFKQSQGNSNNGRGGTPHQSQMMMQQNSQLQSQQNYAPTPQQQQFVPSQNNGQSQMSTGGQQQQFSNQNPAMMQQQPNMMHPQSQMQQFQQQNMGMTQQSQMRQQSQQQNMMGGSVGPQSQMMMQQQQNNPNPNNLNQKQQPQQQQHQMNYNPQIEHQNSNMNQSNGQYPQQFNSQPSNAPGQMQSQIVEDYTQGPIIDMQSVQMPQQQQQQLMQNTRLKVDINSTNYSDQRRQLNSGGGVSVHTPMSQVSGYSHNLAPQSNRFPQQPTAIIQHSGGNSGLGGTSSGPHGPSPGGQSIGQPGGNINGGSSMQQQNQNLQDRKVTGKSSIRTLIKAAATRDY